MDKVPPSDDNPKLAAALHVSEPHGILMVTEAAAMERQAPDTWNAMTGPVRNQVMPRERMPRLQAPPLTVAEPILERSA
ncbi:hypothetical protein DQX05_09500 [Paenibacillus thiaminolyticus]|uniref:Uncharacterized protein n=1 Tax=Paenibacillus thiaminolyticus TaxID=49283 RepID=A0A3A3GJI6_PANTH|nr:hypothetical protein DQX05_09500 [Paenibacillus thiaminolyticus]